VLVPESIRDGKAIPRIMSEKHGCIIMGGQDELEGKIFRLSHFGHLSSDDIVSGLSALELTLRELGHAFDLGAGVSAGIQVLDGGFTR